MFIQIILFSPVRYYRNCSFLRLLWILVLPLPRLHRFRKCWGEPLPPIVWHMQPRYNVSLFNTPVCSSGGPGDTGWPPASVCHQGQACADLQPAAVSYDIHQHALIITECNCARLPPRAPTVTTSPLPASACGARGVRCIVRWNTARKTPPTSLAFSPARWCQLLQTHLLQASSVIHEGASVASYWELWISMGNLACLRAVNCGCSLIGAEGDTTAGVSLSNIASFFTYY